MGIRHNLYRELPAAAPQSRRIAGPNFAASLLLGALSLHGAIGGAHGQMASGTTQAPVALKISGSGLASQAISLSDLKALPHQTVVAHNGHTNADENYSGVPLIALLVKAGAPSGKDLHGKALSEYIVATRSDGYKAVLALAEADPAFHPGEVIVADALNGKPLEAKTGPFKLVVSEDKRPARSVHSLVSIELRAAE